MKIPALIGGIVVLVAAVLYIALNAPDNVEQEFAKQMTQSGRSNGDITIDDIVSEPGVDASKEEVNSEKRRIEMQMAFSRLEKARKELKSHANLLKSKIWGRELPADQARMISHKMRQAYAYLKNPPMLGAYREVNDIQNESNKVQAMLEDLTEVEQWIAVANDSDG